MLVPGAFILITLLAILPALVSCQPRTRSESETRTVAQSGIDLNKPVPEPPPPSTGLGDFPNMTTEELWAKRCAQCHDKELGLDKYKGREWYPIVARMMKKPRSYINAAIARELYVYLYKKTTGEEPPDIEEYEDAPVSSAGETFGGG